MGNWACNSYKKKKAKNQKAGHNLKTVCKEETSFIIKYKLYLKSFLLNN
jgi:hypothetical protein